MRLFLTFSFLLSVFSSFFAAPIYAEEGSLDVAGTSLAEVGGATIELGSVCSGEILSITSFSIEEAGGYLTLPSLDSTSPSIINNLSDTAPIETNLYIDSSAINLSNTSSTIEVNFPVDFPSNEQLPTFEINYPSLGISPNPGLINQPPLTVYPELDPTDSPLVTLAKLDLMVKLGVAYGDILLVSMVSVDWPDASLGCPEEGMFYAQVITPGHLIVLEVEGEFYNYHTDGRRVVFCSGDGASDDQNDGSDDSNEDDSDSEHQDEDENESGGDNDGVSADDDESDDSGDAENNNEGDGEGEGEGEGEDENEEEDDDDDDGQDEDEGENEDEGYFSGSEGEDEQNEPEENSEDGPDDIVEFEEDNNPQAVVLTEETVPVEAPGDEINWKQGRSTLLAGLGIIFDFSFSVFRNFKRILTYFYPLR